MAKKHFSEIPIHTKEFKEFREKIWLLYALADCQDQILTELQERYILLDSENVKMATKNVKSVVSYFDKICGWDRASLFSDKFEKLMKMLNRYVENVKF